MCRTERLPPERIAVAKTVRSGDRESGHPRRMPAENRVFSVRRRRHSDCNARHFNRNPLRAGHRRSASNRRAFGPVRKTTVTTTSDSLEREARDSCTRWKKARAALCRPEGADDAFFVELAGLAQRTRALTRLLGEERAETVSVAMEAVCTLVVSGSLCVSAELESYLLLGVDGLLRTLGDEQGAKNGESAKAAHDLVVRAAHSLLHGLDIPLQNAYGGFCVAFPVDCASPGAEPLRIRGFDLLRLEKEGLSLFVLEFPRRDMVLHPAGFGGVLSAPGRSGHVFDVRLFRTMDDAFSESSEGGVRVVYGSTLAADFVEALTGLPPESIFAVNPARVRRYQPSWGENRGRKAAPVRDSAAGPEAKHIDDLVREYDRALKELFRIGRASGEASGP